MTRSQRANAALGRLLLNRRSILTMLLFFMLSFCGVTAHMLWQLRDQTWHGALRGADNVLTALSQDIARNIETMDLSLQAVVDGLNLPGFATLEPQMRRAVLFDRAATARHLGSTLLLDETGRVIEDAGSVPPRKDSFADRDYFRFHRNNPASTGLYISAPFHRRLTGPGDLVIALSRRVDKPDGSFGGVVVGTWRLDSLRNLFEHITLGEQGAVTLVRDDGTLLMRTPFDRDRIGQSVTGTTGMNLMLATNAGRFTSRSVLDGVTRTTSFTRIEHLPLLLSVGLAEPEVLAAWNGRALGIGLLTGTLCLVAVGLGILFSGELRRRFRAEAEMRESEAELRLLANHATDVIIRLDAGLVRRYVSPSCAAILGYQPADLVGRYLPDLLHPGDREPLLSRLAQARHGRNGATVTYRIRHRDGSYVWVESQFGFMAGNGGFTVVLRDITARKAAEAELAAVHAELARIAVTDALTNLANRRRFDEALALEWARAAREDQPLTLLLLDIDFFKQYNDRYGHGEGDRCIRAVADTLGGCMRRPTDLAARYGGEEFAILLPGTSERHAAACAEAVRSAVAALGRPHAGNHPAGGIVTISIGTATIIPTPRKDAHGMEPDVAAFIARADTALYAAKQRGRNRVVTEADLIQPDTARTGTMEADAAKAPQPVHAA